jgi:DNA-binding XRE family transcriptional regulator/mannose-6-phosphate isomerase-like protein (cupin superfamily)
MNDPRRIEAALAANLREWRSRRGWSQAELARRAGLSKGMLVQVEQAQTNPSIATLCKLANALGIALPRLVEVSEEPVVRRVTASEIAWLWRGRTAASAAGLIAGVETPVPVELWEWRIGARDGYDAIAHPPATREFVYVLDGAAAVTVDGVEVIVSTGECAVFQADRPHRYASAQGRATRFVMVVIEPIESPAPERRRRRTSARAPGARPR